MNLKTLKNKNLLASTQALVAKERKLTAEVLWHLLEIDRRKLFIELGYPSLFGYCMKALGYEESAALRRISAMRLLRELPEIEAKLETGSISLTAASQVQQVIRAVRQKEGRSFSREEKLKILERVEGKTTRETQRILCEIAPEAIPEERVRIVSPEKAEMRIIADRELMDLIQRVRELGAHRLKGATDYGSLLKLMARIAIEAMEPKLPGRRKKGDSIRPEAKTEARAEARAEAKPKPEEMPKPSLPPVRFAPAAPKVEVQKALGQSSVVVVAARHRGKDLPPAQTVKPVRALATPEHRHIPRQLRHQVWLRDLGQCTHLDPATKARCQSRYALEIDHILPTALGGESSLQNLRLLCRTHNQWAAIQIYGSAKMQPFLQKL